ncbi:hypothetical protein [Segatella sp.]|uniref:hypothetical protein n=1 Tax=Segatella sp. TaxID=2974253 RepID=UPI003AAA2E7A
MATAIQRIIMIHQKFNKIYTKQYIDEFLASLPNCDVEKALRELSYINASAFKGYGKLSADLLSYNDMIYTAKESALRVLVDKFKGGIKVHDSVVYFRLKSGIQLSFHVPYKFCGNNELSVYLDRKYYVADAEVWDGVMEAYTYEDEDIDKYIQKRDEYRQEVAADRKQRYERDRVVVEAIRKYFHHWARRRMCGITMNLKELNAFEPFALTGHFCSIGDVILRYNEGMDSFAYDRACQGVRELIGTERWNELNTFKHKKDFVISFYDPIFTQGI